MKKLTVMFFLGVAIVQSPELRAGNVYLDVCPQLFTSLIQEHGDLMLYKTPSAGVSFKGNGNEIPFIRARINTSPTGVMTIACIYGNPVNGPTSYAIIDATQYHNCSFHGNNPNTCNIGRTQCQVICDLH